MCRRLNDVLSVLPGHVDADKEVLDSDFPFSHRLLKRRWHLASSRGTASASCTRDLVKSYRWTRNDEIPRVLGMTPFFAHRCSWSSPSIALERRGQARIVSFCLSDALDLGDHAAGHPVHHIRFGRLAPSELADDAPLVKDQDAVADSQRLLDLRGGEQQCQPLAGQLVAQEIDLGLRADVDTPGGVIDNHDLGTGCQPFGDDHLLLVATGKIDDPFVDAIGGHVELPYVSFASPRSRSRSIIPKRSRSLSSTARLELRRIDQSVINPSSRRLAGISANPLRMASKGDRGEAVRPLYTTSPAAGLAKPKRT